MVSHTSAKTLQASPRTILPGEPIFSRKVAWWTALVTPALLTCIGPGIIPAGLAPSSVSCVAGIILSLLLLMCAVTDTRKRKIYNWATYPGLLWALALPLAVQLGGLPAEKLVFIDLSSALLGSVVCFVAMLLLYSISGGGAGDVKLATVIGGFLGVEQGLLAIALTYVLAAVAMLTLRIWQLGPWHVFRAFAQRVGACVLPRWIDVPNRAQRELMQASVPLGGFFAVGTLIAMNSHFLF